MLVALQLCSPVLWLICRSMSFKALLLLYTSDVGPLSENTSTSCTGMGTTSRLKAQPGRKCSSSFAQPASQASFAGAVPSTSSCIAMSKARSCSLRPSIWLHCSQAGRALRIRTMLALRTAFGWAPISFCNRARSRAHLSSLACPSPPRGNRIRD